MAITTTTKGEIQNEVNIMSAITKVSSKSRAIQVQNRLQEIYASAQRDFIEMGTLICEAEDASLWAQLEDEEGNAYKSLDQWLSVALPYGRTTAYMAKTVVRELKGVSPEQLREIPRINLKSLLKLPPAQRKNPKWIKSATVMPSRKFSQEISLIVPREVSREGQRIMFTLSIPTAKIVNRALTRAGVECEESGINCTKEMRLEWICKAYLGLRTSRAA